MDIKFTIQTWAYVVAEFFIGERGVKIGHSADYGDAFQELLNKLFFVYNITDEELICYCPYSFRVLWKDDRVNYSWEVSLASPTADFIISIQELSASGGDYKQEIVRESISFDQLFDALYTSLDVMYAQFGFAGYKKVYEAGNFPVGEYLMLKAARQREALWELYPGEEEPDWRYKVPADKEWQLLQSK